MWSSNYAPTMHWVHVVSLYFFILRSLFIILVFFFLFSCTINYNVLFVERPHQIQKWPLSLLTLDRLIRDQGESPSLRTPSGAECFCPVRADLGPKCSPGALTPRAAWVALTACQALLLKHWSSPGLLPKWHPIPYEDNYPLCTLVKSSALYRE